MTVTELGKRKRNKGDPTTKTQLDQTHDRKKKINKEMIENWEMILLKGPILNVPHSMCMINDVSYRLYSDYRKFLFCPLPFPNWLIPRPVVKNWASQVRDKR